MAKKKGARIMAKKYTVPVTRIGYGCRTLTVEANSPEEAISIAMDEAGYYEYSEHDADYEADIDEVSEVK